MLYAVAAILVLVSVAGLITGYTLGAFVHLLLVFAIVLVMLELAGSRRVV
jgi:hypothetical protein